MAVLNYVTDASITDTVVGCFKKDTFPIGAYLRGARRAHYPLPVTLEVAYTFEVQLMLNLCKEFFKEAQDA